METFSRRRLPHWQPDAKVFFVTPRLFGSLTREALERIRTEAGQLRRQPACRGESPRERALREAKRLFGLTDEALAAQLRESSSGSSRWLGNPELAAMVREAIHHRDGKAFGLHRYTVMPNHVHLLIEPLPVEPGGSLPHNGAPLADTKQVADLPHYWPLSMILHGLKRHTARQANRFLGRSGTFWQDESYDHWVRDADEYHRIIEYIDQNPVRAGLCKHPEDWPWSTTGERRQVTNLPHRRA